MEPSGIKQSQSSQDTPSSTGLCIQAPIVLRQRRESVAVDAIDAMMCAAQRAVASGFDSEDLEALVEAVERYEDSEDE